MVCVYCIIT